MPKDDDTNDTSLDAPIPEGASLKHAMSLLDDAELAAINGDDEDDAALAKIAGEADPEDDEDEDDEGTEGANPDAAAAAAPAPAPAPAAAAPAAAPAPAAAAPAPAPAVADDEPESLVVPLPADFEAQLAANAAALKELRAKNRSGEIDAEEYDEQFDKLDEQRQALRQMRSDHEASVRAENTRAQTEWRRTIRTQFKAAKDDGIDYEADADKREDLDNFVKALGARKEHADKSMSWFLQEAHRRVMALHGMGKPAPAPTPAPAPPADPKKAAAAARRAPVDAVPKTLGDLPAGDNAALEADDEFAELDKLDGEAYEDALAAKPAAWRARYLEAAGAPTRRTTARLQ
jgi:hypothetical protein